MCMFVFPDTALVRMCPFYTAVTVLPGVNHQTLPWTCVWYTTKYSSFPQLSNSSPWQRWRHMSSSSSSWREKREVGKPQWHRSPARTASDFSWNTAAITHWTHTHICTMHEHTRPLTLSVHVSTHLSTDMFWMTAVKGSARVTLSGRWKQPLKMALPSEMDRTKPKMLFTNRKIKTQQTEHSFHQLGLYSLTPDEAIPLGLSPSLLRPWPASGLDQ